jgi:RHS repeat-associated protein
LNTPREIIKQNSENVWKWESLPFGETNPNENPSNLGVATFNQRFSGQYKDSETGLHQNWNRDYDPKLGRYITSDPIGLSGGLNTYAYAINNPIQNADPTGLLTDAQLVQVLGILKENLGQSLADFLKKVCLTGAVFKTTQIKGIAESIPMLCKEPGRIGDRDHLIGVCSAGLSRVGAAIIGGGSYYDGCVPTLAAFRSSPEFAEVCKQL